MIYFLIILICGIIIAVGFLVKKEIESALVCGICTLVVLLMVSMCLQIYSDQNEHDYIKYRYVENPVKTQNLDTLPFENTSSDTTYLLREKNSQGNPKYTYCTKDEFGYNEKTIKQPSFGDIYINYITENEQPRFECQSNSQKETLAKKPSFWFNFFGWLKYKNISVGEVIDDNGTYKTDYIFYVPEGSLREIS